MTVNRSLTSLPDNLQAPFEQLMGHISQAFTASLGMLIDSQAQAEISDVKELDNLEDLLGAIGDNPHFLTVSRFSGGLTMPLGFVMSTPVAMAMGDHLMGGAGEGGSDGLEMSDIQMGAVGEVINQVMAGTVNSLQGWVSQNIDITPPTGCEFTLQDLFQHLPESAESSLALISFEISENAVLGSGSIIYIVIPFNNLFQQLQVLSSGGNASEGSAAEFNDLLSGSPTIGLSAGGQQSPFDGGPVTVQGVEFPSFETHVSTAGAFNKNLDLLLDVHLNLTVELGRTELPIKEVLELTRGSVIELNRIAGEAVDLYANGKIIAKGEVVVIEDNFGLRITSILSPADRLKGLSAPAAAATSNA